jgi:hypothetical protein
MTEINEAPVGRLGLDNPKPVAPRSDKFGKHQVVLDGGLGISSRAPKRLKNKPTIVGTYHDYKDAQKARAAHAAKHGHPEHHYTIRSGEYRINESGEEELVIDTTPLIEWSRPEEHAALTEGTNEDVKTGIEEDNENVVVLRPSDVDGEFVVVEGIEGSLNEGDILDESNVDDLRDLGYEVGVIDVSEAKYHVHAEVSPKGIPLTKQHRIAVNADSESSAKKAAHSYVKERGWKIHNIHKVTLAEQSGDLEEGFEEGDLEDQTSNEPRTFSEITAPESIQELSTKTLSSYASKAVDDGHKKISQAFGPPRKKSSDEQDKLAMKGNQRLKHAGRAFDKIDKADGLRAGRRARVGASLKESTDPTKFSEITAPENIQEKEKVVIKLSPKKVKRLSYTIRDHKGRLLDKEGRLVAAVNEDIEDAPLEQRPQDLDESIGTKVNHFDQFKDNVQSHSDHTTTDGNVSYEHKLVKVGDKKWHQTVATVRDREGHNYIRGVFNHKHGKNSPHGHGWTSSPYGDDD